jgi:hypothetical protein
MKKNFTVSYNKRRDKDWVVFNTSINIQNKDLKDFFLNHYKFQFDWSVCFLKLSDQLYLLDILKDFWNIERLEKRVWNFCITI